MSESCNDQRPRLEGREALSFPSFQTKIVRGVGKRMDAPLRAIRSLPFNRENLRHRREVTRLRHLPRYTAGRTSLLGPPLEFVDATSFLWQYDTIIRGGAYDFEAPQQPFVLDVGANIGLATLAIKRQYPTAKVMAIEADPNLAAIAERNVVRAGYGDVSVVNAAAWTHYGEVSFAVEGADAGRVAPGQPTRVRAVRLRDSLDRNVALLKIDVEGAEVDLLADCADRLMNVSAVAVEYHSYLREPQRLAELLAVLESAAMRVSVRHERAPARPLVESDVYNGMDLQLNVWAWRT